MFEIINEYSKKLDLDNFFDYTNFLVKELNLNNCYFNIILVDNNYIQKLNKEYRGKDQVTDVISFALEDAKDDINIDIRMLGDIYICYDRAVEQAKSFNHSTQEEIEFLITHGLLHLLGYDHMNENDEKIMFDKQYSLLSLYQK